MEDSCPSTTTPIEPDASTPLGFTAEEVLAWAAGTHAAAATWGPGAGESHLVEVTPESGSTELELELTYVDGPVMFVDRNVEQGRSDEGLEPALQPEPGTCPDLLLLEVEAHLRTSNGAFDDTFTAQLRASSAEKAELWVPFDLTALQGSLTVVTVEEGSTIQQPTWSATLAPDAFSGTIQAVVEHRHGETVSAAPVTIATWADPDPESDP